MSVYRLRFPVMHRCTQEVHVFVATNERETGWQGTPGATRSQDTRAGISGSMQRFGWQNHGAQFVAAKLPLDGSAARAPDNALQGERAADNTSLWMVSERPTT
jgi:hypothetical protein